MSVFPPDCCWTVMDRGYPAGSVCRNCAAGCASCWRNATHCLSCEEPLFLHKHQCVDECPAAHTVQDGECRRCAAACQECDPFGQCSGAETQRKLGFYFLFKNKFLFLTLFNFYLFAIESLLKSKGLKKIPEDNWKYSVEFLEYLSCNMWLTLIRK